MKNKILYRLSILGLSLSLLPASVFAAEYKDLKKDGPFSWAYSQIIDLSEKNLLSGFPDGNFKPENPVSFLETLKIIESISKVSPEEAEQIKNLQIDLSKYSIPLWADSAVKFNLVRGTISEKTLEAGKKGGFIENKKYPDRNSIVVYLGRAFKLNKYGDTSLLKHKDLFDTPYISQGYLASLVELGIFSDSGSDGKFLGKRYVRRSEMAVIMDKILKTNPEILKASSSAIDKNSEKIQNSKEIQGKLVDIRDDILTIEHDGTMENYKSSVKIDISKIGSIFKFTIEDGIVKNYFEDISSQNMVFPANIKIKNIEKEDSRYKSLVEILNISLNYKGPREFVYYFDRSLEKDKEYFSNIEIVNGNVTKVDIN